MGILYAFFLISGSLLRVFLTGMTDTDFYILLPSSPSSGLSPSGSSGPSSPSTRPECDSSAQGRLRGSRTADRLTTMLARVIALLLTLALSVLSRAVWTSAQYPTSHEDTVVEATNDFQVAVRTAAGGTMALQLAGIDAPVPVQGVHAARWDAALKATAQAVGSTSPRSSWAKRSQFVSLQAHSKTASNHPSPTCTAADPSPAGAPASASSYCKGVTRWPARAQACLPRSTKATYGLRRRPAAPNGDSERQAVSCSPHRRPSQHVVQGLLYHFLSKGFEHVVHALAGLV